MNEIFKEKLIEELTPRGRLIHELVFLADTLTKHNDPLVPHAISPQAVDFYTLRIGEIKEELGDVEDIEIYKRELASKGRPFWKQ